MTKALFITAFTILWSVGTAAQQPTAAVGPENKAASQRAAAPSSLMEVESPRKPAGKFSLKYSDLQPANTVKPIPLVPDTPGAPPIGEGFNWTGAVKQSLMFLAVQHSYAVTQPKTRDALKGPFFRDYFRSVRALHGWDDGGRFFTNYIAHPMQGAFLGFIQVQNDPKGRHRRVGNTKEYWKSRAKALAWSAAWSTQFEIGPLSQASIGNVGLKGKQTYIDIVVTPTIGTAWLVAEDLMDQYVTRPLERKFTGRYVRIFARMLLNPVRTMANLFRFEKPWYRDRGLRR